MKKVISAATKVAVDDDWATAAITDDQMVAELLIRMKHAETVAAVNPATNLPPLRWGIRQRRSRSSRFGGAVVVSLKKGVDSVRASPKTPLSWSDGSGTGRGGSGGSASPSAATADGFEDTSRQASCSTSTGSGSKMFNNRNEISNSLAKRLKKRKSSSQLKEEEKLKLKEKHVLEKEIASLRATFDEQHVRNQRLKRIKLDLNSSRVNNEPPVGMIHNKPLQVDRSKTCRGDEKQRSFFVLPDLNMVPSEEEILYGTS